MRHFWRLLAPVLSLAVAVAACGGDGSPGGDDAEGTSVIRVAGSDDTYPLVRLLSRHFEDSAPGHRVEFAEATHTRGGAASVSGGEADLGLVSRPLLSGERSDGSTYLHLAHDVIVWATHPGLGIEGLDREDLLDVWSGRVSSWEELGGPPLPITVLDRPEHTSLKLMLRRQLLGDSLAVRPDAVVVEHGGDLIATLAALEGAIGAISFGEAVLADASVEHLAVDGVRATPDSFLRGDYPFHRPFGFFVGPEPSAATMRFVRFLFDDEARRITERYGYAPVTMELVIAVLPEQNLLEQQRRYMPLIEHLGDRLGLNLTAELRLLPDYGTAIEEFRAGRVNAAFLGSLAFALAHAQAGVRPIARPERDGVSDYRGLVVTRRDSGISDWSDLEGRSFGFVDRATTAGYLYPVLWLREHGVENAEEWLGPVSYTGSHDVLFESVLAGELDAGAAKDLVLEDLMRDRPELRGELRTLATSPPVPNNTFVLSGNLDFPCFRCHALVPTDGAAGPTTIPREAGELPDLLARMLLELHETERGREVLESLGADRFVETTVDDLLEVNRMIERAGYDPAEYRP